MQERKVQSKSSRKILVIHSSSIHPLCCPGTSRSTRRTTNEAIDSKQDKHDHTGNQADTSIKKELGGRDQQPPPN